MARGRTALLTTLGLAAATVGVAAWAPEAVLAAEFARLQAMDVTIRLRTVDI